MLNNKRTVYQPLFTSSVVNAVTEASIENHHNDIKQALHHLNCNQPVTRDFFDRAFFAKLILTGFVDIDTSKNFNSSKNHFNFVTIVTINAKGKQFLKNLEEQERKARLVSDN